MNTNKNARNIRANEGDAETKEINFEYHEENNNNNNSSTSETSTSILVGCKKTHFDLRWNWTESILFFSFLLLYFPKIFKDDSSATTTENQDNDEASEPIAQHDAESGVAPYIVHESNLPLFIPRPSGNMVKIKCPATGKHQLK